MIDREWLTNLENTSIVELRLGDLHTLHHPIKKRNLWDKICNFFNYYPWGELKKSILKEGYNPHKYGYVVVRPKYNGVTYDIKKDKWVGTADRFETQDGNHRVRILKDLYSSDYKIKVKIEKIFNK